jgi:ubiquinone biosynthesis accessory factor UbiK
MIDPKMLDELARRLAEAVPPGLRELQQDMEKNFHATLAGAFSRMNLVTREEFDVQAAVLARTRAKLEELERLVAELERRVPKEPGPAPAEADPDDPEPPSA